MKSLCRSLILSLLFIFSFFVQSHKTISSDSLEPRDVIRVPLASIQQLMDSKSEPVVVLFSTPDSTMEMACFEFATFNENARVVMDGGKASYRAGDLLPRAKYRTFQCRQNDHVAQLSIYKDEAGLLSVSGLVQIEDHLYTTSSYTMSPVNSQVEFYSTADLGTLEEIFNTQRCGVDEEDVVEDVASPAQNQAAMNRIVQGEVIRSIKLGVDVDHELWERLTQDVAIIPGDVFANQRKLFWAFLKINDLVAAANVIFYRDLGVTASIAYFSVFTTPEADPIRNQNSSSDFVDQYGDFLNSPAHGRIPIERTFFFLFTGKDIPDAAGRAHTNGYCKKARGHGFGEFLYEGGRHELVLSQQPHFVGTLAVFVHELGHLLGSPHSWVESDYNPRWECCRMEDGRVLNEAEMATCMRGLDPEADHVGTLMSYCPTIYYRFHEQVQRNIAGMLQEAVDDGCVAERLNQAPHINRIDPVFLEVRRNDWPDQGFIFRISVDATDADQDNLYYVFSQGVNGESVGQTTISSRINLAVPVIAQNHEIQVSVCDFIGACDQQSIFVNTTDLNRVHNMAPACQINLRNAGVNGRASTFNVRVNEPDTWQTLDVEIDFGDRTFPLSQVLPSTLPVDPISERSLLVEHVYRSLGPYTVRLTVDDRAGGRTVCSSDMTLTNLPPTLRFVVVPQARQYNPGEAVSFVAQGLDSNLGDPVYFVWNFGDGSALLSSARMASDGRPVNHMPSHSYYRPGVLTASAYMVDSAGNRSEPRTTNVTVLNAAPVIERLTFNGVPRRGQPIQFIVFANDRNREPLTYAWEFKGEATRYTQVPTMTYTFNTDILRVVVSAIDAAGARASVTRTLSINDAAEGRQNTAVPVNMF